MKIIKFLEYIKENATETPQQYISIALDKLKNKLEAIFKISMCYYIKPKFLATSIRSLSDPLSSINCFLIFAFLFSMVLNDNGMKLGRLIVFIPCAMNWSILLSLSSQLIFF